MNRYWLRFTVLLAIVASCSGTSVERDPTKKKGAGPLFQIYYGKKWGFMDRTGKIVIEPQFADESDFFDGLARVDMMVGNERRSCFIDEKGKRVIPCKFDRAQDFSEGLAVVQIGRLWGYIDRAGKTVIRPRFQGAAKFREGLARVEVWDRIRCHGKAYSKDDAPINVFSVLDDALPFMSDCIVEHPRFGYIDQKGRLAISPQFRWAENFSEGLAAVQVGSSPEGKFGFIDKTGKIVIPAKFDIVFSFSEGLAAVETGFRAEAGQKVAGKYGFIDNFGKFVIHPRFEMAFKFSEGLARACENMGAWGYIDRTGRFVISARYGQAWDFSGGLAAVWPDTDGGFIFIDRTGKKVLKPKGGRWSFSDGLTVAGERGKRVYIDRTGRVIAPYEVDPGY